MGLTDPFASSQHGLLNELSQKREVPMFPRMITSGGQTGADRAALDWAISQGIDHGGWCPKGRLATDGAIPAQYQLTETESGGYRQRTKRNVQDSDATLIFNTGAVDGGTLQTVRFAQALKKPYRVFQLDERDPGATAIQVVEWWSMGRFSTVNIAGPREEKRPGISTLVTSVLNLSVAVSAIEVPGVLSEKDAHHSVHRQDSFQDGVVDQPYMPPLKANDLRKYHPITGSSRI
jgi:hypothetical protein